MTEHAANLQLRGIKLGLVPTMGYLHEGHLSLIRLLDGRCDLKAASIFVNPIQFGPGEDLKRYPRDEDRDVELLEKGGCELVFAPDSSEMYPSDYQTYVDIERMSQPLCGQFRPGHFRGVATVVLRLFNLTRCSVAAFGLKDYQQAMVLRKMVHDLHLPVELIFGETVRETDGLAMSSRNAYLTPEDRQLAQAIPRALKWVRIEAESGSDSIEELKRGMKRILTLKSSVKIQYIEFVHPETLEPCESVGERTQVLVAVFVGGTRLIDNVTVGVKE